MRESPRDFDVELRPSPKPVIVALWVLGSGLIAASEFLYDPGRMRAFALLVIMLSASALIMASRYPRLSRWFVIAVLIACIHVGVEWLRIDEFAAFAPLAVVVAMVLIGPYAAAVTTVAETVILLLLSPAVRPVPAVMVTLIAVWGALGVACYMHRLTRQISRWLGDYFTRTRDFLEQARSRRAELEKANEDLARANEQLALASQRMAALRLIAEQADKSRAAFVANVSHEFRTPLNIIIGMVDMMVEAPEVYDEAIPQSVLRHLHIVYRNCRHLADMVDDVLDLTQIEAGKLAIRREWSELGEIVNSAVAVVRPMAEEKSLRLDISVTDHLPTVYCDATRVRQVILNLLSNAARLTEDGGITVSVCQREGHGVVSVTDTGPGIAEEDVDLIFEPFFHTSRQIWHQDAGTGLGLSISRELVELHHGRMWVESELGVGTTFFIDLPIAQPLAHAAGPGRWIREDWVWREQAFRTDQVGIADRALRPRIIVCDDTGEAFELLARHTDDDVVLLETESLSEAAAALEIRPAQALVVAAPSPQEALHLLEEATLMVPDTPIVGCCLPPRMRRVLESGAVDYLVKPVTRVRLGEVIAAVGRPISRVLIVEDEADARELLSLFVSSYDPAMEVLMAASGREALALAREGDVDLVLLDLVLSDVDGWQVLAGMREDARLREIPTVVISGQDQVLGPPKSGALIAGMGEGIPFGKVLRCSRELASLLLSPD